MEEGRCQYLRALAVVEVIYSNLDSSNDSKDLGGAHCTWAVWHSLVPTSVMGSDGSDGLARYQGITCGETVPPTPAIWREPLSCLLPLGLNPDCA